MSLFVVRHCHEADACPAADLAGGADLLNHLSRSSATRHGIRIHGEAVLAGAHELVMIVEADTEPDLRAFLQPLEMAGTVEVRSAVTCARVVASGGCAAAPQTTDADGPVVDPEVACQEALDAGLVVHRAHPLNCETSLPRLVGGAVMPNARFYVRNHFHIPDLRASHWRLRVDGLVKRPLTLSLDELRAMPSQTAVVTLECAGNGRSGFEPAVPGEPWGFGAVSTAEWTGVPLSEVLDQAMVAAQAKQVLFRGADRGIVEGRDGPIAFERSLALDDAREPGVLLAYAMNGDDLPLLHGYPVRMIVPGWYAVASVKWLTNIELTDRPFDGHFQVDKYHIDGEPVSLQRVRALVIQPHPGQVVQRGEHVLRGVAWSGAAPIARVEVSVDDQPWQPAVLIGDRRRHSWQWWELRTHLEQTGTVTVRARATDLAGRTQPDHGPWNALGYGNNAVHEARVEVH